MSDVVSKYLIFPLLVLFGSPAIACDTQRISDGGTDILKDSGTGLIWRNCSLRSDGECATTTSNSRVKWDDARQVASNNEVQGWRLPSVIELSSIIRPECADSETVLGMLVNSDQSAFSFWTSNLAVRATAQAWAIDLKEGETKKTPKNTLAHGILLVRDLKQND